MWLGLSFSEDKDKVRAFWSVLIIRDPFKGLFEGQDLVLGIRL